MRVAIAIFYWLCAVLLVVLSLHSERDEEEHIHPGRPWHPGSEGKH
jgi:hypothetical protein